MENSMTEMSLYVTFLQLTPFYHSNLMHKVLQQTNLSTELFIMLQIKYD